MKKTIATILMALLLMTTLSSASIAITESKIGLVLDKEVQTWDEKTYGSMFLKDGRTFIPIRVVSEKLGYKVSWNEKTNSADIEKGETKISFTIGQQDVSTPKGVVTLDVVPFTMKGRTYVPMRGLFEAIGMEVRWLSSKVTANELETSITNMKSDFYVVVDKGTDADTDTDTDTGTESDPDKTDKPITDKDFLEEDGGLKTEFWEKFLEKNVPAGTETYASETLVLVGQSNWINERNSDLSISPDHDEIWITIQGVLSENRLQETMDNALQLVSKTSADGIEISKNFLAETIPKSWSKAKDGTQYRVTNDAGYGVTIHIKQ